MKRYKHLLTFEERQHLEYADIRTLAELEEQIKRLDGTPSKPGWPQCWMCRQIGDKIRSEGKAM